MVMAFACSTAKEASTAESVLPSSTPAPVVVYDGGRRAEQRAGHLDSEMILERTILFC